MYRTAVQSYMENEKRRKESLAQGSGKKKKSEESRQSASTQEPQTNNNSRQMATVSSSASASDDDERMFNVRQTSRIPFTLSLRSLPWQIEKTFTLPRPTPASQQSTQNVDSSVGVSNIDHKPSVPPLAEISRLQEFDIQRTLLPISHASVPLSSNIANENDSSAASLHLRSYVPLSRPGMNGINPVTKSTDTTQSTSREGLSVLSSKTRISFIHLIRFLVTFTYSKQPYHQPSNTLQFNCRWSEKNESTAPTDQAYSQFQYATSNWWKSDNNLSYSYLRDQWLFFL